MHQTMKLKPTVNVSRRKVKQTEMLLAVLSIYESAVFHPLHIQIRVA
jgi:hypothetical protein